MQKKYTAIRLLPVLLILLFSMLSLMLVLSGAGVYKNTVENTRRNNEVRASLSYVSNKVRSAEGSTIRIEQRNNIPVLLLTESIEDTVYETMIYVYDGSLCEMFSSQGRTFHPENGTEISQVSSFEAKLENHLLSLRMEDDNQKTYETKLSIRQ